MDISIIIVSYNVKQFVLNCLTSIYKYIDTSTFEIIVVDNNSIDGSVSAIKDNFPQVKIIENKINVGFSQANNQGFSISNGKYFFMLNPDAELKENSINLMVEFINNNFNEAQIKSNLVAPFLENSDGSFQKSYWNTPTALSILWEILFINYIKKIIFQQKVSLIVKEVECVSGAAMFFHHSLITKVGYLDKDLFWMDDTDFCYRIRKHGGQVYYCPLTKIIHHIGKSSSKNQNISISSQILSKIKFFKKHKLYISYFFSIIFSFVLIIEKILIFAVLSTFNKKSRIKLKSYLFTLKKWLK